MSTLSKQTINLDKQLIEDVREIAKSFGLTVGRGPNANDGSIQQLVEAIGKRELVVMRTMAFSHDQNS